MLLKIITTKSTKLLVTDMLHVHVATSQQYKQLILRTVSNCNVPDFDRDLLEFYYDEAICKHLNRADVSIFTTYVNLH